jgi:hypothetical protein
MSQALETPLKDNSYEQQNDGISTADAFIVEEQQLSFKEVFSLPNEQAIILTKRKLRQILTNNHQWDDPISFRKAKKVKLHEPSEINKLLQMLRKEQSDQKGYFEQKLLEQKGYFEQKLLEQKGEFTKKIQELEDKLVCSDRLNFARESILEQDSDRQVFIGALKALRKFLDDKNIGELNEKLFPYAFHEQAKVYDRLFDTNINASNRLQYTRQLVSILFKSASLTDRE